MSNYSVFKCSEGKKYKSVKDGKSFAAAFLMPAWAFYYKMWTIGGISSLVLSVSFLYSGYYTNHLKDLQAAGNLVSSDSLSLMTAAFFITLFFSSFVMPVVFFFKGNAWLVSHLKESPDYIYRGNIKAENEYKAEIYFSKSK